MANSIPKPRTHLSNMHPRKDVDEYYLISSIIQPPCLGAIPGYGFHPAERICGDVVPSTSPWHPPQRFQLLGVHDEARPLDNGVGIKLGANISKFGPMFL